MNKIIKLTALAAVTLAAVLAQASPTINITQVGVTNGIVDMTFTVLPATDNVPTDFGILRTTNVVKGPFTNSGAVITGGPGTFDATVPVSGSKGFYIVKYLVAPPTNTTGSATALTAHCATLIGSVNPGSADTVWYFQYGQTAGYGLSSSWDMILAGGSTVGVTNTICGLLPGTLYHYSLFSSNKAGIALGADASFTTATSPYVNGDLLVGFSSSGAANDYVFDVGPGSSLYNGKTWILGANVAGTFTSSQLTNGHFGVIGSLQAGAIIFSTTDGTFAPSEAAGAFNTIKANVVSLGNTVGLTGSTGVAIEQSANNSWHQQTDQPGGTPGNYFFNNLDNPNVATTNNAYLYANDNLGGVATALGYFTLSPDGSTLTYTANPPADATGSATTITPHCATLNGTINPGGLSTIWYFAYGATASYGSFSTTNTLAAGAYSALAVSNTICGLLPGTLVHYQIIASNADGVTLGADASFTTATSPYVNGDLLVGFSSSGAANDYVFDVGPGSSLYNGETWTLGARVAGTFTTAQLTNGHFGVIGSLQVGARIFSTTDGSFSPSEAAGAFNTIKANVVSLGNTVGLTASTGVAIGQSENNSWHQQTDQPGGTPGNYFFNNLDNPNVATTNNVYLYDNDNLGNPATALGYFTLSADGNTLTYTAYPPVDTTGSATTITPHCATLNGTINPGGISTIWYFAYGATASYGSFSTTNTLAAGAYSALAVSNTICGLLPGTLVHYQIVASNADGVTLGADASFTTATSPYVNGDLLVGFSSSGAANDYVFDVGPGSSLYNGETWTLGARVAGTFTTAQLTNGHFGVIGSLQAGARIFSTTDGTFAPSEAAGAFNTIKANVVSLGNTVGLTASTGVAIGQSENNSWHQQTDQPGGTPGNYFFNNLDNPNVATTNNAYLYDNDNLGNPAAALGYFTLSADGNTLTYTAYPPVDTTGSATTITPHCATLNGTINPGGISTIWYFAYGLTTSYGSFSTTNTLGGGSYSALAVSNTICGLLPGTLYHYRVVASNADGVTLGADASFTTATSPYVNGDLLVGFTSSGAANDYVFDVGLATNLYDGETWTLGANVAGTFTLTQLTNGYFGVIGSLTVSNFIYSTTDGSFTPSEAAGAFNTIRANVVSLGNTVGLTASTGVAIGQTENNSWHLQTDQSPGTPGNYFFNNLDNPNVGTTNQAHLYINDNLGNPATELGHFTLSGDGNTLTFTAAP